MADATVADPAEQTLHFLLEASQAYALLAPAVSRALSAQLRAVAAAKHISLHSSVTHRLCRRCSQTFVPGSNCTVTLKKVRRKRRKRALKKKSKEKTPTTSRGADHRGGSHRFQNPPHRPKKLEEQQPNRATLKKCRRCVVYRCKACGARRRFPLAKRSRLRLRRKQPSQVQQARGQSQQFRVEQAPVTAADHRRQMALEEARNAAAAVKRAKKAAKVAAAAKEASIVSLPPVAPAAEPLPEPTLKGSPENSAPAGQAPSPSMKGTAAAAAETTLPVEVRSEKLPPAGLACQALRSLEEGPASKRRRKVDKTGRALEAASSRGPGTGLSDF